MRRAYAFKARPPLHCFERGAGVEEGDECEHQGTLHTHLSGGVYFLEHAVVLQGDETVVSKRDLACLLKASLLDMDQEARLRLQVAVGPEPVPPTRSEKSRAKELAASLQQLLETPKGQRVMQPTFGSKLPQLLQGDQFQAQLDALHLTLQRALELGILRDYSFGALDGETGTVQVSLLPNVPHQHLVIGFQSDAKQAEG